MRASAAAARSTPAAAPTSARPPGRHRAACAASPAARAGTSPPWSDPDRSAGRARSRAGSRAAPGLAAERGAQAIHDQERWAAPPRHEPQRPETVLRKRAWPDPLAIGALPRRVLGRDRQKAATPAPDHRALVERADDLRRLGVDQARGIELLVRVVLVSPAVLASRWPSPALVTCRRSSVLSPRPASRVPLATARSISRSSSCMSAWSERASVAASFM